MKGKLARILFILLLAVGVVIYGYSWKLSQPKFDETLADNPLAASQIAPIEDALTFARLSSGEVLLVLSSDIDGVTAIDLSDTEHFMGVDGIDAYQALGRDQLVRLTESLSSQRFSWQSLSSPLSVQSKIVAAGTNFKAHAEEVNHSGDPFLFPKLSTITPWNAVVTAGTRLDHEVEICAVSLEDYPQADVDPSRKVALGYLLCGDYTDRWLLVKEIDLDAEMGTTGFAAGKGGATRLPVGPFVVIPQSHEFYKKIDMKLYVNNELRQSSNAGLMNWNPWTIMSKSLEKCDANYLNGEGVVKLLDNCERIPAKTLFLTGTPEGVMFSPLTLWNSGFYLKAGDLVTSQASYLGVMRNVID